ncbi:MAG: hypothetical protein HY553_08880 [Elusimicrobia bacterium]|nr:hypothetical protein [Elusimicrobiota bacterium]
MKPLSIAAVLTLFPHVAHGRTVAPSAGAWNVALTHAFATNPQLAPLLSLPMLRGLELRRAGPDRARLEQALERILIAPESYSRQSPFAQTALLRAAAGLAFAEKDPSGAQALVDDVRRDERRFGHEQSGVAALLRSAADELQVRVDRVSSDGPRPDPAVFDAGSDPEVRGRGSSAGRRASLLRWTGALREPRSAPPAPLELERGDSVLPLAAFALLGAAPADGQWLPAAALLAGAHAMQLYFRDAVRTAPRAMRSIAFATTLLPAVGLAAAGRPDLLGMFLGASGIAYALSQALGRLPGVPLVVIPAALAALIAACGAIAGLAHGDYGPAIALGALAQTIVYAFARSVTGRGH